MTSGYPLRVDAWSDIPGLVHGFLGRAHGVPAGPFTTSDVHDALVRAGESPRAVAASLQVHGIAVLSPEDMPRAPEDGGVLYAAELPEGDVWVSASADVVLTIRTADCVPILLVAPRAHAVAAVHAGWRGTLDGAIEAALAALTDRYDAHPEELSAAIGPAIDGCCYEFGREHFAAFEARFGPEVAAAWRRTNESYFLDLRSLCRRVLERAHVPGDAIHIVGPCTAEHPDELHSHRRDGPHAGRQLSYIGWRS
ncbi:MAG: polyphenol oxidase family protein [Myxococcales bacterium]|nr:polyphenol oxidase family protein [Myxococcales bacterium]